MAYRKNSEGFLVVLRKTSELNMNEKTACIRLVNEGGAVNAKSAAKELPKAHLIAFAICSSDIVGVGAIKRVRIDYATRKAAQAGFDFDPNTRELGYVAVSSDHRRRGLSTRLIATLIPEYHGPLFATTSSELMKSTLRRFGFEMRGGEWAGQGGSLSLWLRPET